MDLIRNQDKLQQEAHEVLEKMQLLEILSEYGKPHIVGSVVMGLMTWRDIDVEVIVNENFNKNEIAEIISKLVNLDEIRIDFSVIDNRNEEGSKIPTGIYLGLKYFGKIEDIYKNGARDEHVWQLDIHFVLPENSRSIVNIKAIKDKLTDEKRLAILEIKNELKQNNPKYKKGGIYSTDVYNAVLDNGVKNIEEFKKYLEKIGKEW